MRILHTVAYYPPDHGGGATEVVRQVSERLVRRGHDVTVATAFSPRRESGTLNGVAVKQFRVYGRGGQSVLGIRGETRAFERLLLEGDFDLVMNYAAQTWHTDLTCRCLPAMQARTVLAACGFSGLVGWRRPLYWGYFRRLARHLRQYDAVIYHAAGYRDAQFGARHGIAHGRIIPNGVDASEFAAGTFDFRAHYAIRTPHIVLCVGDHFRNKGHRRVLEAFARMNRPDVTLVIIGRRPAGWLRGCWTPCRRAARPFGPRVLLLDRAPRPHVTAAYRAAGVLASGSAIEAFPLVILEAMAAGLPFVAFPAGNTADLPGGVIVTSAAEMAAALDRLLNADAERAALGAAGRSAQRARYEWDAVVDRYEALYTELLARPRRAAAAPFARGAGRA